MKSSISYFVALMCAIIFTACGSGGSTSVDTDTNVSDSVSNDSFESWYLGEWKKDCDSINHYYTTMVDYVWRFVYNVENEYNYSKMLEWHDASYARYIHSFDSVCPSNGLNNIEKIDSMMSILYNFIVDDNGFSRLGESINSEIMTSMIKYRTCTRYKYILAKDAEFANEIVAWLDFQNKFLQYTRTYTSLDFWGGNIQTSINSAIWIDVEQSRLDDLNNLCKIYNEPEDDIKSLFVETTKDLFVLTMKIATEKVYNRSFMSEEDTISIKLYDETYEELLVLHNDVLVAFEKWYAVRLSMNKNNMPLHDWCKDLYKKQTSEFILNLAKVFSNVDAYYFTFN